MSELSSLQETIERLTERLENLEAKGYKEEKENEKSLGEERLLRNACGQPFSSFTSTWQGNNQECSQTSPQRGETGAGGQQRPSQAVVPPFPNWNVQQGFGGIPSQNVMPQVSQFPQFPVPMYASDPRQGYTPIQPDFRSQYEAIKNSVGNIVLEPDFVLNENRSGITGADREQAVILACNGKFVETQLRLMQQLQESFTDQDRVAVILDRLHVVQKAKM